MFFFFHNNLDFKNSYARIFLQIYCYKQFLIKIIRYDRYMDSNVTIRIFFRKLFSVFFLCNSRINLF